MVPAARWFIFPAVSYHRQGFRSSGLAPGVGTRAVSGAGAQKSSSWLPKAEGGLAASRGQQETALLG